MPHMYSFYTDSNSISSFEERAPCNHRPQLNQSQGSKAIRLVLLAFADFLKLFLLLFSS